MKKMKQVAFDNLIKIAFLLLGVCFLYIMSQRNDGRYKYVGKDDYGKPAIVFDSKTGFIYKADSRQR